MEGCILMCQAPVEVVKGHGKNDVDQVHHACQKPPHCGFLPTVQTGFDMMHCTRVKPCLSIFLLPFTIAAGVNSR